MAIEFYDFFNLGMLMDNVIDGTKGSGPKAKITNADFFHLLLSAIYVNANKDDKDEAYEELLKYSKYTSTGKPYSKTSDIRRRKMQIPDKMSNVQHYIERRLRDDNNYMFNMTTAVVEFFDEFKIDDERQLDISKKIKSTMIDKMPYDFRDKPELLDLYNNEENISRILSEIFIRIFKYRNLPSKLDEIARSSERRRTQEPRADKKKNKDHYPTTLSEWARDRIEQLDYDIVELEQLKEMVEVFGTMSPEELEELNDLTNRSIAELVDAGEIEITDIRNDSQSNDSIDRDTESPLVLKIVIDEFAGNVADVANRDNEIEIRISRNQ